MPTLESVFSKSYLDSVHEALSSYSYSLLYRYQNQTNEQIEAGWQFVKLQYILAAIGDHIFDYFCYSSVLNEEQSKGYIDFFHKLKTDEFHSFVSHISDNLWDLLDVVDTLSIEGPILNIGSWRRPYFDDYIIDFVDDLLSFSDELQLKFSQPKESSDPSKPSPLLFKKVLKSIESIQDKLSHLIFNDNNVDVRERAFAFFNTFEQYRFAVMFAWHKLNYGDHTDFMKEGDSLFNFAIFESEAHNIIPELLDLLQNNSPFDIFDKSSKLTQDILSIISCANKEL